MIVDTAWANAALDALAGPGKAAGLPATMWVALYDGDPSSGGAELAATGGYVRLGSIDMTDVAMWPAASGGAKSNALRIQAPTYSTGPWPAAGTWAVLIDSASGAGTRGPACRLAQPVIVSATGKRPELSAGAVTFTYSYAF